MNVVITGASSGIGRSLVRTFAREGHGVLAIARRSDRLQALCREMAGTNGGGVHCLALDITTPGAPSALLEEAVRIFGTVHVLINNAGMSPYQQFQELDPGHLRQILFLNAQALTELCHVFVPHMLTHGEPSYVVNVGSVGGYAPLPNFSVYSGTKHYVRAFTNMLRHELRHTNIRVSTLHPGGTFTEFQELAGQRVRERARSSMKTSEDVAARAYPAILRGKRIITISRIDRAAILMGKLLPFPLTIRVMEAVYRYSVEKVPPAYPLPGRAERGA